MTRYVPRVGDMVPSEQQTLVTDLQDRVQELEQQVLNRDHELKELSGYNDVVTAERDDAVRIAKELVGLALITDADIRWAEELLAAKKHQDGLP